MVALCQLPRAPPTLSLATSDKTWTSLVESARCRYRFQPPNPDIPRSIFPRGLEMLQRRMTRVRGFQTNSCKSRRGSRRGCRRLCRGTYPMVRLQIAPRIRSRLQVSRKAQKTDTTTSGPTSIQESSCRAYPIMGAITSTPTTSHPRGRTRNTLPPRGRYRPRLQ